MTNLQARVLQLHKTESEWAYFYSFVPEASELVVYDPDETYSFARFKIGDGKTALPDLPFKSMPDKIDGGRISTYPKKQPIIDEGEDIT